MKMSEAQCLMGYVELAYALIMSEVTFRVSRERHRFDPFGATG